jgi:MATE family multidrug resistance protein
MNQPAQITPQAPNTRYHDWLNTLRLSLPIVIGQLSIVAMGVADNIMVGKLGAAPLAATGLGNHIFFMVAIVGIGILSIVAPQVATAKSRNDTIQCTKILSNAFYLSLMIGALTTVVLSVVCFNFSLLGQTPEVEQISVGYLFILAISAIPMFMFIALKNFTDGLSYTKAAMYFSFGGVILNIILNWFMIYGNAGFPKLGVNGSAYATMIARILMFAGFWVYVQKAKYLKEYLGKFSWNDFDRMLTKKLFYLGAPSAGQYVFEVGAFVGAAVIIGWLGTNQLAAHEIAISLSAVTYMGSVGFSAAGAIQVGSAFGERNPNKIRRLGSASLGLVAIFMGVCGALFLLFTEFWVRLYVDAGSMQEVIQIAIILVWVVGIYQMSDGIQCVALGNLRGLEDTHIPTYITFVAYWIVGLPLGYFLAFSFGWDVLGVWIGLSVGLTISAVLLTWRFYYLAEKLRKTAP